MISTDGTLGQAYINITDCQFRSLTNARIQLSATKLTVLNSVFSDLGQTLTAFISVTNNYGPDYELRFKNITIKYISYLEE